ncbi:MAG: protein-L-isoaspartate(D-aspartate) O-methyltransferase [Chitinophagales bacterium]
MNQALDTYRHKGMRQKLVDILRDKGIADERVLTAINAIPRHTFMDAAFLEHAYEDKAFQIGEGQTISQPYTVAYMTEWLELEPNMKVLEVGTGSGYQASVLAEMGTKVFTIERFRKLHEKAKQQLYILGYNKVKMYFGDGYEGIPVHAPYDRIIITAAAKEIPQQLLKQLKAGGIIVLPLGNDDDQMMVKMTKTGENDYRKEIGDNFRFVPMLPGKIF